MNQSLEELVWNVRRLFRELAQAADAALADLGMTAAERALLEFLAKEEAPISLSEIARKQAVSRQLVHQTLGRLDPAWIERLADATDARSITLRLSREGRAQWKKIRAIDSALLKRLGAELDEGELRRANATLCKLRGALSELRRSPP